MPAFGPTSRQRLNTCDPRLLRIFERVVQEYDCTILEGYRDRIRQDRAFNEGKSTKEYPDSVHNSIPSRGVDVAPYYADRVPRVDWKDTPGFCHFAGYVQRTAEEMGYKVRWGGDWDGDRTVMKDQTFQDLVHFEIVEDDDGNHGQDPVGDPEENLGDDPGRDPLQAGVPAGQRAGKESEEEAPQKGGDQGHETLT